MTRQALPDGWEWSTLGDHVEIVRGVSYDKSEARDAPGDGLVAILRATNIGESLVFADFVYVPKSRVSHQQFLRVGDVLVAASSGSRSVVGKAAPVLASWSGSFGAFCLVVRPRGTINPKYLAYFMQCPQYRLRVSTLAAGVNINNLKRAHIAGTPLPVAPDADQIRIVDEIEKQLTRLDAGVGALKRLEAHLRRYRATVLKAACEGRLVPTEAALARKAGRSYEDGDALLNRILSARRAFYSETRAAKRYTEPAAPVGAKPSPEGWSWATVEQLSSAVDYGSSAKTREVSDVPVLRMGNIVNGMLDITSLKYLPADHQEFPRLLLQAGDVLFNRTNSPALVGKTAVYEGAPSRCSFASYLIRVRLVEGYSPSLLAALINSPYGREWVKEVVTQQVGQANVNGTKLQALAVPVPPESEQARIVAALDERITNLDASIGTVERALGRASRLRAAILREAFEGRLTSSRPTLDGVQRKSE